MVVLVDGYNLLHAIGLATKPARPGHSRIPLRTARRRMLDWLADAARSRPAVLRVVFDAQEGIKTDTAEQDHRGVRVRFAFRQTADDLIEAILAAETQPAETVVVSNDGRLHEAARRRGAVAWSCQRFMDWLADPGRPPAQSSPPAEEKPAGPTPDEAAELARAFEADRRPRR
jgi:predicted RNA-binding protein with PIN domain